MLRNDEMKQKELLSVIVPIYNSEEYLAECVASIIRQTYENLEIILVDDGSTDSSGILADELCGTDSRIKVIHKKNGGILSAKYTGSVSTHGKYITFVDSDDWIDLNMYQVLMDKMTESSADLVTSGHFSYCSDGQTTAVYDKYIAEGIYDKSGINDAILPIMLFDSRSGIWSFDPSTCCKLYCREKLIPILEKVRSRTFYFGEDQVITYLYLLQAEKVCCTHKCFYYHRQRKRNELTPYFVSDEFFQKLNELYYVLYSEFKKHEQKDILKKQLDYSFSLHTKRKIEKYETGKKHEPYYLFPFHKVRPNAEYVIYGAGRTGRIYVEQIRSINYGVIAAWVDKNYLEIGNGVCPPQVLTYVKYDYVVIALVSEEAAKEIKRYLLEIGIEEKKIIHEIVKPM